LALYLEAPAGVSEKDVYKKIERLSGGEITQYSIGGWQRQGGASGTTVFLLGLRGLDGARQRIGWGGWGFDFTDQHDLKVDRLGEDGARCPFDQHPLGRKIGHLPSTDWSFRAFLAVMFLQEGT
jgi:hypothetical protein